MSKTNTLDTCQSGPSAENSPSRRSGGGTGRHVRLRGVCRKACGFKSRPEHFSFYLAKAAILGSSATAFRTDLGLARDRSPMPTNRARIVFDCRIAKDPAIMSLTLPWNSSLNVRRVVNTSRRCQSRSASWHHAQAATMTSPFQSDKPMTKGCSLYRQRFLS